MLSTMRPMDKSEQIRHQLLVAALREDAVPGKVHRKCAVVIRRALTDAGKWSEQAAADMYVGDGPSDVGDFYRVLISMVGGENSPDALFVGQGDLGLPAAPHYTECRLSSVGEAVALTVSSIP